ncbi:hypothetical protein [Hugenholtzia roseola]|uniref:hypothetical protein n=1 Tax=Hugenholtzia roseola TaxID=1002 RepID=UPI00047E98DC|nr:hypothetical protein [Hugenholtzia roseola]
MKSNPKHKTALLIWIAVYPSITVLSWLLEDILVLLPIYLRTLLLTLILVPLVVYLLLPLLTRLLQKWLNT